MSTVCAPQQRQIKQLNPHPGRFESVWQSVKYKKWRQLRVVSAPLGQECFDWWFKERSFSLNIVYLMVGKTKCYWNVSEGYFNTSALSNHTIIRGYMSEDDFDRNSTLLIFRERPEMNERWRPGRNKQSCHPEMGKQHLDLQCESELHPRERRRSTVFLVVTKTDARNLETWRHTEKSRESFLPGIFAFMLYHPPPLYD